MFSLVQSTHTRVAIFCITYRTFLLVFHVGDTTQSGYRVAGEWQTRTAQPPSLWGFAPMETPRK
jgi:hypothetical protein